MEGLWAKQEDESNTQEEVGTWAVDRHGCSPRERDKLCRVLRLARWVQLTNILSLCVPRRDTGS